MWLRVCIGEDLVPTVLRGINVCDVPLFVPVVYKQRVRILVQERKFYLLFAIAFFHCSLNNNVILSVRFLYLLISFVYHFSWGFIFEQVSYMD
jgi:transcriptional regulator of nitric oxide reductase